jgi:hypothetical protein
MKFMAPPDDALHSASPAQAHDPEPDQAAARTHALRMQALEAVIGDGLSILDEIKRRALRTPYEIEEEHKPEPADLGLTFDRISRAVRFTVAQHERLEIEAGKSAEQRQAEAAARAAAEAQRLARAQNAPSPEEQAKKQEQDRRLRLVERAVNRAICEHTEDYDEREEFTEDLNERLEEIEDLGLGRPVGAVVFDICRAMRVPFDLRLWEDEPWALSEAETKAEGSPYAKWRRSANERAGGDPAGSGDARYRRGVGPP